MSNHNVRLGYQFINVVKRFSSILTITILQESKEITEDVVGLYMTGWSGKRAIQVLYDKKKKKEVL